jgi:hypothetical protein
MGDVFCVVLDMGEDHEDDWWEYYGTAKFDLYRAEQTAFLEEILEAGEYEDYRYRLALCHMPIVYVDGKFEGFRQEWTDLLNEMDIDMCLSGHKHKLWPFVPDRAEANVPVNNSGSYLTDFDFPGFLVGRRSLVQQGGTQQNGYDRYTGLQLQVDFKTGIQTACYVNSLGEILDIEDPFAGDAYREFRLELSGS